MWRCTILAENEPGVQSADGVSSQIGCTSIERQRSPAATKRGPTAVAILQIEQPTDAAKCGRVGVAEQTRTVRTRSFETSGIGKLRQGEQRTRRVVGVGDSAAQVAPAPAAGRGAGEGVTLVVLAGEEPFDGSC